MNQKERKQLRNKLIKIKTLPKNDYHAEKKFNEIGITYFSDDLYKMGFLSGITIKWWELEMSNWKCLNAHYEKAIEENKYNKQFRNQLRKELIKLGTLPAIGYWLETKFDELTVFINNANWEKSIPWESLSPIHWWNLYLHYEEFINSQSVGE